MGVWGVGGEPRPRQGKQLAENHKVDNKKRWLDGLHSPEAMGCLFLKILIDLASGLGICLRLSQIIGQYFFFAMVAEKD